MSLIAILKRGRWKLEPQAYTRKRCILIQVLPPPNAYTKSANACIGKMNAHIRS